MGGSCGARLSIPLQPLLSPVTSRPHLPHLDSGGDNKKAYHHEVILRDK